MSFTYDVTNDIGKVRLLVPDREAAYANFTDEEIEALLGLNGQDVRYAAAECCDTIASNEAMILRVTSILDVSVDGTRVAAEMRARAATLRRIADELSAASDESDVASIEMLLGPFSIREQIVNAGLRDA